MPRASLEELVDVCEARARQYALPAHVAELSPQVSQEIYLELVGRREVCVPALRRHDAVALSIRDDEGLAEAGPRGDQRQIASGLGWAGLESEELLRRQREDAVGRRLQIVDELDGRARGR